MQRFTISLDEALATQFDALIAARGYVNRSEAVRDLIRTQTGTAHLEASPSLNCMASINYVYNHHETSVTERILALQHNHHDLVVTSLHTQIDHDHCLETVVLRGPTQAVKLFSQTLIALRGVRHGNIHLVPLTESEHRHAHANEPEKRHTHFKPLN